jgi:hypothetical protein
MKHRLAVLCFTFLLAFAGQAAAQSLMEQGMAGTVGMGALYGATRTLKGAGGDQEIMTSLQQQGYTNVAAVASSETQYTAFHQTHGPVVLNVDPKTKQVISVMPR